MKRFFDILLVIFSIPIIAIPFIFIYFSVVLTSKGPSFYWSERVGKNQSIFFMPKFRTLKLNTPQIATHLLQDPEKYYTPIGKFLRRTSLDELPQVWSILLGDMSFVGPRPALYNQDDLIALREEKGINKLIPGLTGWAQINGRDEISIREKVNLDYTYLKKRSLIFDIIILFKTIGKALKSDEVTH